MGNPLHIRRAEENLAWWESEVEKRLPAAGSTEGEISRFRALGNLVSGNLWNEKLDRLDAIIGRLEGRSS
jgi:hypothetical protein